VWSDLFIKTPPVATPAPALADLRIEPVGWGSDILGLAGPVMFFIPNVYNYLGANNDGIKVPNTYKQVRVTPQLAAGAPATASVRINGVTLPAAGYVDLTMPAAAGTPFQVKVDVSAPNAQTSGYTVLLKENVPAVTRLYVADSLTPDPRPDGNGNYEVRLQPGEGQTDVAVRMDIEPEMTARILINGAEYGPVLPPNALNGWQFTVPLNAASPTDVSLQVKGPGASPEIRAYTLRLVY
jgi:hypothetical protein